MSDAEHAQEPRSNPLVGLLLLVVVGAVFYAVARGGLLQRGGEGGLPAPPIDVGNRTPIDLNWRVRQMDGPEMSVADLRGNVILLNFWEHWCPPCRAEMPSIQRLGQMVAGEDIVVLPVFTESEAATRKFLQEQGLTLPVYHLVGSLPQAIYPSAIPTTYIIDRQGRAVIQHVGAAAWDDEGVLTLLRKLAAEGAPAQAVGKAEREKEME